MVYLFDSVCDLTEPVTEGSSATVDYWDGCPAPAGNQDVAVIPSTSLPCGAQMQMPSRGLAAYCLSISRHSAVLRPGSLPPPRFRHLDVRRALRYLFGYI